MARKAEGTRIQIIIDPTHLERLDQRAQARGKARSEYYRDLTGQLYRLGQAGWERAEAELEVRAKLVEAAAKLHLTSIHEIDPALEGAELVHAWHAHNEDHGPFVRFHGRRIPLELHMNPDDPNPLATAGVVVDMPVTVDGRAEVLTVAAPLHPKGSFLPYTGWSLAN